MTIVSPHIRHNYLAIVVAAVACFLFEAVWYSFFLQAWLNGVGRSREWLISTGVNPMVQYGTALLSAALIATAISGFTQLTGPQTAVRGMEVAGQTLWLGCVLTTWATEYVFEVRTYALFAINTGFWLIGMVLWERLWARGRGKAGSGVDFRLNSYSVLRILSRPFSSLVRRRDRRAACRFLVGAVDGGVVAAAAPERAPFAAASPK